MTVAVTCKPILLFRNDLCAAYLLHCINFMLNVFMCIYSTVTVSEISNRFWFLNTTKLSKRPQQRTEEQGVEL